MLIVTRKGVSNIAPDTFWGYRSSVCPGMIKTLRSGNRMSGNHLLSSWYAFQNSVEFAIILTLAMCSLGIVTIVSGIICRGLRMLTRRLVSGRVTLTLH